MDTNGIDRLRKSWHLLHVTLLRKRWWEDLSFQIVCIFLQRDIKSIFLKYQALLHLESQGSKESDTTPMRKISRLRELYKLLMML